MMNVSISLLSVWLKGKIEGKAKSSYQSGVSPFEDSIQGRTPHNGLLKGEQQQQLALFVNV